MATFIKTTRHAMNGIITAAITAITTRPVSSAARAAPKTPDAAAARTNSPGRNGIRPRSSSPASRECIFIRSSAPWTSWTPDSISAEFPSLMTSAGTSFSP